MKTEQVFQVPGQWTVSSYYTLSPAAPDGSGRMVFAACDLAKQVCSVFIFDADGKILANFGHRKVESMFFHTGCWESWSPDSRYIYYQSGTLAKPSVSRYDTVSGKIDTVNGVDLEGAPASGEPIICGLPGMLYGAGYGYNVYNPSLCPVPFEKRSEHGIFEFCFDGKSPRLLYSVNDFLEAHPQRERLLALDRELAEKYNRVCGLSLMAYCVRWDPAGESFLVYFGNHCVVPERNEPRISHVFTGKRGSKELSFAFDVSGRGVHWSCRDAGTLVGFIRPEGGVRPVICSYNINDGSFTGLVSPDCGGGHPSLSLVNRNLCVNDENANGCVKLWDCRSGKVVSSIDLKCRVPGFIHQGTVRNEKRCCHHPKFTSDGRYILSNFIDENNLCAIAKIRVPEELVK